MQQPHGFELISHRLPERDSTELVATILRNTSNTMLTFTVKTWDVDQLCVIVCHMLLTLQ
jgi:hypothetical protein